MVIETREEELDLPEELVTVELEENIDPATELTNSQQSSTIAGLPSANGVGQLDPTFNAEVIEDSAEDTGVELADLTVPASLKASLMTDIPIEGDPRSR